MGHYRSQVSYPAAIGTQQNFIIILIFRDMIPGKLPDYFFNEQVSGFNFCIQAVAFNIFRFINKFSSESVSYFKAAAKKNHMQYQKMIRQLLDEYVAHQKSANK